MRAMIMKRSRQPLVASVVDDRIPGPAQILLRVHACAVCRTDLHIVDGELTRPKPHLVPGHEIVGRVVAVGDQVAGFRPGDRLGVPWLGWTCGECRFCRSGRENLCERAKFTGYDIDGGYAELAVADQHFCFRIPDRYDDAAAAPLLCAGLIGYRALKLAGPGERIGIYGFGAAAHLIAQVAIAEGRRIFALTRPGDAAAQDFARGLGAAWAGGSDELPPEPLEAALIFAPVGALVPAALRATEAGGVVVCAGIHMSDIPSFSYDLLWRERIVRSVANLTRKDGEEFFEIAARVPLRVETIPFRLDQANEALDGLRAGRFQGAAVLTP
ncbi:MAG TPA: zinc-dependent alcohol dehydrogenase family protein [Alphaproteobacteria bacterium]|nr:zinc-dependent alcohol dehydrogenase family protein [Alphaproteobacteria bacterium]